MRILPQSVRGVCVYIGRNKLPRTLLKWADRSVSSGAVILGSLSKVKPEEAWSALSPALQHIQGGLYIPAALILAPLTAWLRRSTDNARLDDVHRLLDQLRDATFKNETPELEQHRRVTLFRHRKFAWCWPFFGGILVPIERSGTSTRRTKAFFRAPDDGEHCEGVAGRAWGKHNIVQVSRLPDLKRSQTDADIAEYSKNSFISEQRTRTYLSTNKTPPRSLLGMPIEVDNRLWGVLVFDSTGEEVKKSAARTIFGKLSPTLVGYLKGL